MEDLTNSNVSEEVKEEVVTANEEAVVETAVEAPSEVVEVTEEPVAEEAVEETAVEEAATEAEPVVEEKKVEFKDIVLPKTENPKDAIIQKFKRGENDTGSPEVQIALLTTRISLLTAHLKQHPKDHHSRRGLLMLIGQRRRMLSYLMGTDINRYRALIAELGLRK